MNVSGLCVRALLCATSFALAAGAASAQPLDASKAPTPWSGRDSLAEVPVFYIADAYGRPRGDTEGSAANFYLNRTQASLALGYARGQRGQTLGTGKQLHVEVTDLARASAMSGARHFVKPPTVVEAANSMDEAPLFMVRDKAGAPYTLRGADGRRRTYFFLNEGDAIDFVEMVVEQTGTPEGDIRLSLAPLPAIVKSMLAADKPEVKNWAIWSNDEAREDAAVLKAELKRQSAGLATGKP
jgi:hypothetical protein